MVGSPNEWKSYKIGRDNLSRDGVKVCFLFYQSRTEVGFNTLAILLGNRGLIYRETELPNNQHIFKGTPDDRCKQVPIIPE